MYPHPQSGSPPKFNQLSSGPLPTSLENFMQIRKLLRKVVNKQTNRQTDRQTNNDENTSSLAEVIDLTYAATLLSTFRKLLFATELILTSYQK